MRQKSIKPHVVAEVPRNLPMYDEDKVLTLGYPRSRFGDAIFPGDTDRSQLKSCASVPSSSNSGCMLRG